MSAVSMAGLVYGRHRPALMEFRLPFQSSAIAEHLLIVAVALKVRGAVVKAQAQIGRGVLLSVVNLITGSHPTDGFARPLPPCRSYPAWKATTASGSRLAIW